ncbi:apurinic/apyrimidinic endonuclease [Perkinsela sp. CCAP 1560/4]|nr:apurinic/apyrimidinic endonuclease [Perkinsela sp. CCAP 1560/4]|eukprot:KNH07647.1 apurinic/apyrimidinic endonuclease [Perkinsela sp. CCAP 1560/4]
MVLFRSSFRHASKKVQKLETCPKYEEMKKRYPNEAIPRDRQEYFKNSVYHRRQLFARDYDPSRMMKIITWNVASLRSICNKYLEQLNKIMFYEKPDILCLQETKLSTLVGSEKLACFNGYTFFDSISMERKGYSGTRTYIRSSLCSSPSHTTGFSHNTDKQCIEGRVTTTRLAVGDDSRRKIHPSIGEFWVVNTYVPTSGLDKETGTFPKLGVRLQWDEELRKHFQHIQSEKKKLPIIWTGDFNVLFDLDHHWKKDYHTMMQTPGFCFEERYSFRQTLLDAGLIECFRHKYPNSSNSYTFWSNMERGRIGNRGLRLDGFAISRELSHRILETHSLHWIKGSDHCPVALWLAVD